MWKLLFLRKGITFFIVEWILPRYHIPWFLKFALKSWFKNVFLENINNGCCFIRNSIHSLICLSPCCYLFRFSSKSLNCKLNIFLNCWFSFHWLYESLSISRFSLFCNIILLWLWKITKIKKKFTCRIAGFFKFIS